ncbi:kinase-like domain-containing protein [Morchella snyderi]|nr:kinase-like domain-containing protein [Morchella snyderi]
MSSGWGFSEETSAPNSAGWGFSEENSSPNSAGWGFESNGRASALHDSEPEPQIMQPKRRTRRIMTTLAEFTMRLAQSELGRLDHGELPGVAPSPWTEKLGAGSQFTVFLDTRNKDRSQVIKRVNVFDVHDDGWEERRQTGEEDPNFRRRLYLVEREILILCHPSLRKHRNIAEIISWGYDYREDSNCPRVPILYMERALCSLFSFLTCDDFNNYSALQRENIGYQICLDVAEGLAAIHKCGIVHGDIKPHNILIFPQENVKVPYVGKLSDFGACVSLQDEDTLEDFAVYRGTPNWRPPEAVKYVKEKHGSFSPELLLRCDSFSYGLLVLSVFTANGNPPLSKSLELAQQASYSSSPPPIFLHEDQGTAYPSAMDTAESPLDDALTTLNRASHLGNFLQTKIRFLLPRVLRLRPENRELVGSEMLADVKEEAYLNWRLQRDDASPSSPHKSWNNGSKILLNAAETPLKELDEQHD